MTKRKSVFKKSLIRTRNREVQRVAIALSGGVDSGTAAALVVKAGFKVAGFHMKLWQELFAPGAERIC